MLLYLFVFICSFSLFTSDEILYPMEKDSKLGEHICRYTERLENHDTKTYVKPCEEGKYCVNSNIATSFSSTSSSLKYDYYICRNYTKRVSIKVYDEPCTSDYECDSDLYCDSNSKCSAGCTSNEKTFKKDDGTWGCKNKDVSDEFYYYCKSFQSDNSGACKSSSDEYIGAPSYLKVGGIISFEPYYPEPDHKEKGQLYRIKSIANSDIGSVEDDNFVSDFRACKSGFTLNFYLNKEFNKPYSGSLEPHLNQKYPMCVTLNEVDTENERIKYSINGGEEKVYKFSASAYDENKLIKIELFKKYAEAWNKNKGECEKTENYNDHNTCNVDEVTKWYYFYDNHLDNYRFYYAEDEGEKYKDVIRYLIQTDYPFYQSGLFLNIKYLISLLILLLI